MFCLFFLFVNPPPDAKIQTELLKIITKDMTIIQIITCSNGCVKQTIRKNTGMPEHLSVFIHPVRPTVHHGKRGERLQLPVYRKI